MSPLKTLSRCLFSAMHEAFDRERRDEGLSRANRKAIQRMEAQVEARLAHVVQRIGPRCASVARAREVLAQEYTPSLFKVTEGAAFLALRAARSEPLRLPKVSPFPPLRF